MNEKNVNEKSIGATLKERREQRAMSVAEVARLTRISASAILQLEADRFDDLPGDVYVRGFLRGYASALGLSGDAVVSRYVLARRQRTSAPMVMSSGRSVDASQGRFGVAIASVLLLLLFTLAMSIVFKPRRQDLPGEMSMQSARSSQRAV